VFSMLGIIVVVFLPVSLSLFSMLLLVCVVNHRVHQSRSCHRCIAVRIGDDCRWEMDHLQKGTVCACVCERDSLCVRDLHV
jgi:hypothetical protein